MSKCPWCGRESMSVKGNAFANADVIERYYGTKTPPPTAGDDHLRTQVERLRDAVKAVNQLVHEITSEGAKVELDTVNHNVMQDQWPVPLLSVSVMKEVK